MGGDFHDFDAVTQPAIAAVDAVNGNLLAWNPHLAGFGVEAIAFTESFVALGGEFMAVDGAPRAGFALFRSDSAAADDYPHSYGP